MIHVFFIMSKVEECQRISRNSGVTIYISIIFHLHVLYMFHPGDNRCAPAWFHYGSMAPTRPSRWRKQVLRPASGRQFPWYRSSHPRGPHRGHRQPIESDLDDQKIYQRGQRSKKNAELQRTWTSPSHLRSVVVKNFLWRGKIRGLKVIPLVVSSVTALTALNNPEAIKVSEKSMRDVQGSWQDPTKGLCILCSYGRFFGCTW